MGISVDSLDAAKHDKFRGLDTPTTSWRASRPAKQAGLPFQLHTTVVDWNRDEVCAITDFAVEIGAIAHYVFFLIPVGRGKFIQETSLEVLENERLLNDIMTQGGRGADRREAHVRAPVHARGEAARRGHALRARLFGGPHVLRHRQRGHRAPLRLHDRGGGRRARAAFDEIWKTSPVFRLRTQAYSGSCGTCDYAQGCGGCRARAAYYHDGDILAQDDYCAHGNAW